MADENKFAGNFFNLLENFQTKKPPNQKKNDCRNTKKQDYEGSIKDNEGGGIGGGNIKQQGGKEQGCFSGRGRRKIDVRKNSSIQESLANECNGRFEGDSLNRPTKNVKNKSQENKKGKLHQGSGTPTNKVSDTLLSALDNFQKNKVKDGDMHELQLNVDRERQIREKDERRNFKSENDRADIGERFCIDGNRIHGSKTKASFRQNKDVEGAEQMPRNSQKIPKKPHKVMGYKFLESLLDSDTSVVLTTLASRSSGFEELVNSRPLRPDLLILIIKVLDKINSTEAHQLKMHVYSSTFKPEFIDEIKRFVSLLCVEDNKKRLSAMGSFFINLLSIFDTVVNILPSIMNEKLRSTLTAMKLFMKSLKDLHGIDVGNKPFEQLEELIDQVMSYMEHKNKMDKEKSVNRKEVLPPNSYRELPLVPTKDDFITDKCYLRQNIVKGSYISVDHYLDVQFRLLREDFIAPLREGIYEYIGSLSEPHLKRKYTNVRIYPKVKFENPFKSRDIYGFNIQFDCARKLPCNINWEYNKRFMTGSLLLFSDDDFQTFYLATVVERKIDQLQKGLLFITFVPGTAVPEYLFDPEVFFVMAESEVYYEAYKHVLSALQRMNENNFPMKQYIVDVDRDCSPPVYLMDNSVYKISTFNVNLLDDFSWPSPKELNLNPSQHQALKSALTNDFAVIQGPPGTGKTFLALKITEILLKNEVSLNAPIVVVCYTNHALDQFLEGILKYTKNLVRIGSQSQNEALQQFNLEELKKKMKASRTHNCSAIYKQTMSEKYDIEGKLQGVKNKIEELGRPKGILDLSSLKSVVIPRQYNELAGNEMYWLFCEDNPELLVDGSSEVATDPMPAEVEMPAGQFQIEDNLENSSEFQEEYEFDAEENSRRLADMTEDDFFEENLFEEDSYNNILRYCLHYKEIENLISNAEYELENIKKSNLDRQSKFFYETHIKDNIQGMVSQLDFLRQQSFRLRHLKFNPEKLEMFQNANLWMLNMNERWEYYMTWIHLYVCQLKQIVQHLTKGYQDILMELYELRQLEYLKFVQSASVVGLTTSGAARRRVLLENLGSKIVIVEEAAEVLEAHIVTSLAQSVQHVILIGDHKQLKPNPAVFKLAKKYNMDCSLFERMINNGLHCSILNEQHRMRPEMASLICPTIYQKLANHHSTYDRPSIRGVDKFVFFLAHNHPEDVLPDTSSRQNKYEADLLMALCKYLLLNDYKPEEITILATYTGQVWYMRKRKKDMISSFSSMRNVRITPVDNFQGEENRIILLSLVRSNKESRIGFLSTENRVCVALSRAKEGLYIVGNMDNLTSSSTIWPRIKQSLEAINAIGPRLILRCDRHPGQITQVSEEKHFKSAPEGGCTLKCEARLQCGHTCPRICHIIDRHHGFYKCQENCDRPPCTVEGHKCPLRCFQTCKPCEIKLEKELPCGHTTALSCHIEPATHKCMEDVPAIHPACGHDVIKPCYMDPQYSKCSNPCSYRLPCGHACRLTCHKSSDPDHLKYECLQACIREYAGCSKNIHPCPKYCYQKCEECQVLIKTVLPCDHRVEIPCSLDPLNFQCKKPCKKVMTCGHQCKFPCWVTCNPEECTVVVEKEADCGHIFSNMKCNEPTGKRKCTKPCLRKLPCGHPCPDKCFSDCNNVQCKELVDSCVAPACGHRTIKIPCHLNKPGLHVASDELVQLCDAPCGKTMNCGHQCTGTCGMCLQGRLHIPCEQQCSKILFCGHKCTAKCSKLCPPCTTRKCLTSCSHRKCYTKNNKNHLCFQSCDPCNKQCLWVCKHYKCGRRCGEECNRPACYEPCSEVLSCGHNCIGFCGEPCPPLCAACNVDDPAIKDDLQARYVMLTDCKHIIESKLFDKLVADATRNDTFRLMKCPKCADPIANTMRCRNVYFGFRKQVIKIDEIIKKDEMYRLQRMYARHVKLMASEPTNSQTMNMLMNLCSKPINVNVRGSADKSFGQVIVGCLLQQLALKCEDLKRIKKEDDEIRRQSGLPLIKLESEQRLRLRLEYLAGVLFRRIDQISDHTIQQIELVVAHTQRLMPNTGVPLSWYDITPYTWEVDRRLVARYVLEDPVIKLSPTLRTRDSSKQWFRCNNHHLFVSENGEPCVVCKDEAEENQRRMEEEMRNKERAVETNRYRGPNGGRGYNGPIVTDYRNKYRGKKNGGKGYQRNNHRGRGGGQGGSGGQDQDVSGGQGQGGSGIQGRGGGGRRGRGGGGRQGRGGGGGQNRGGGGGQGSSSGQINNQFMRYI